MHTPGTSDADRYSHASAGECVADSDLSAVAWLCSPEGRREADSVAPQLPLSAAQLRRLRDRVGRRPAEWLITTAGLRRSAEEKLGHPRLVVTDRALQQSTDSSIAAFKAARFPRGTVVWDLCCGIGGDAMSLVQRGPVVAVDRDPLVCRLAAHNLARAGASSAAVLCRAVDPATVPRGSWIHIDPDRRAGARRAADPQHSQPPPATIEAIFANAAGGAIKLSPAAEVPERWGIEGAREWVSRGGSCRQQVVWFGTGPASATRAATTIDRGGDAHTFIAGRGESPAVDEAARVEEWIFDFDPAVRAAGLSGPMANRLGLRALGGPPGFFTADRLPSPDLAAPSLYQSFAVLWHGPMEEKKLRRRLADGGVASLEIKVRGVDLTPEILRKRLLPKRRATAGRELSLLIGRSEPAGRVYAAVAERCGRNQHV